MLLLAGVPSVEVTGATRIPGQRSLNPDRTYRATATPVGEVELRRASGRLVGRYRAPLALDARGERVRLGGRGLNSVSGGQYRGTLFLHPDTGGLSVVNLASLEEYLRGVVPGEMPSSWHRQALRAQAVAARS